MASVANRTTGSPSVRASAAKEKLHLLPDNQIVYIDRLGPRILCVPPNPTGRINRETLRELSKGNLTGSLSQGARFLSKWMIQCPEITISTNGQYTVQKRNKNSKGQKPRAFTVKTLNIWTGEHGILHEDRNIQDLLFYSVGADLLPSYHSWKDEKLERRETSLDLEQQQEAALAEKDFTKMPKPIADLIDDYKEKHDAKMEEVESNDPDSKLRIKPGILPSDPAWEGVEEYFKWILQLERDKNVENPQVYQVLEEELIESQRLLAIPAIDSGYRAKIQDENTRKYHEALRTTFKNKPDNLTTKLTMLCFGLPIEPLTVRNIKFAGGLKDVPGEDDKNTASGVNVQMSERITWSENPLEFLDSYNERSYGYPMIRTQKRKYEEIDNESREKLLTQAEQNAKLLRLSWNECGFDDMEELETDLHMRGGAGELVEIPHRRYRVYTEMGSFLLDVHNSFGAFCDLAERLFKLRSKPKWACQIDLVPNPLMTNANPGALKGRLQKKTRWHWTQETRYLHQPQTYDRFVTHVSDSKDKLRFYLRYNDGHPNELDMPGEIEPSHNRNTINLEVKDVGIAYWTVMSSPPAVNLLQDGFREAIECLIPQHRMHRVEWSIIGMGKLLSTNGLLTLIAEAPSTELWKATQEAIGVQSRVTVHLAVIDDALMQSNPLRVKILMPGFNHIGEYNRLPDDRLIERNWQIFDDIRSFALQRTVPNQFPLRIWAGVENYDYSLNLDPTRPPLSMVLPAKKNLEAEEDIWQSLYLAFTWDAVVVKPEFDRFVIIYLTGTVKGGMNYNTYPSEELMTHMGLLSLDRFRNCVIRLSKDFNAEFDYICIEQPQSGHNFFVNPEMTERQWQISVYDCLESPTIAFKIYPNWDDVSSGPTSWDLPELRDGQSEDVPRRTPPLGFRGLRPPRRPSKASLLPLNDVKKTNNETPKEGSVQVITTESSTIRAPTVRAPIGLPTGPFSSNITQSTEELPRGSLKVTNKDTGASQGHGVSALETPFVGLSRIKPARVDPFSSPFSGVSTQKYQEWRKQQALQEALRVEAYVQDGTIYPAEGGPDIPLFGPPLEGNIPVSGRTFPKIYTIISTPTENMARDQELQALRKIVLERLEYCGICEKALPGGDHNLAKRKCHFEEHRKREAEAQTTSSDNAIKNVIVPIEEAFYCEYCGKTSADFEENTKMETHAHSCAQLSVFCDTPRFCQYCCLDFWDRGMADESIENHWQKCADNRRFSLQGQISLYQQLLNRVLGNKQLGGESRCHFQGCEQIFNSATTNFVRSSHFWNHLERNDQEEHINKRTEFCPFADCNKSLNDMTEEQTISHLRGHVYCEDDDSCPISKCGLQLDGLSNEQVLTHLMEHVIDKNATPVHCPFIGCDETFINWTAQQIITHINMDFARNVCPFPGCGMKFVRLSGKEIVLHLNEHVLSPPTHCPFPGCPEDYSGWTQQEILTHLNMHLGGSLRRCPFQGCGLELISSSPQKDMEHLLGHVLVPLCPFQTCKLALNDLTKHQKMAHLGTHLGPKRGPSTHHCPFEGCTVSMRGWSNQKICKHASIHIANNELAASTTDTQEREHIDSRFITNCQWPGCEYTWDHTPSVEELFTHVLVHTRDHPVESRPQGPPPGQNSPNRDTFEEEDQNFIPPRLKAFFSGFDFYCPKCFYKVSGRNASACKRHRKDPCNIVGHDHWLVGTDNDKVVWKINGVKDAVISDTKNAKPVRRNTTLIPPQKESKKSTITGSGSSSSLRNGSKSRSARDPTFQPPLPGQTRKRKKRVEDSIASTNSSQIAPRGVPPPFRGQKENVKGTRLLKGLTHAQPDEVEKKDKRSSEVEEAAAAIREPPKKKQKKETDQKSRTRGKK